MTPLNVEVPPNKLLELFAKVLILFAFWVFFSFWFIPSFNLYIVGLTIERKPFFYLFWGSEVIT